MREVDFVRPQTVCLDASTACQLQCPACPTAGRVIKQELHTGYLKANDFRKFLEQNTFVRHVELSNWGEMFLNPQLREILEHAHACQVTLSADNGVNFNQASETIIEALVRYHLRSMTVSIDGASQATYMQYRVGGDFDQVLRNIRLLNQFKQQYRSEYPRLRWQFIAFGHNQHEIEAARKLAASLDMAFYVKLAWDDLYTEAFSPVTDRDQVRQATGLGVADRQEYLERYGKSYIGDTCAQLWLAPRINFDGRLLGCSINYWSDYGNVFTDGLSECLADSRLARTRQMLQGVRPAEADSPCLQCQVYNDMQASGRWLQAAQLQTMANPKTGAATQGQGPRSMLSRLWSRLAWWRR
jgi:MoaA/NifB/PqqE/SkfB family radical SAM enzyme